jgi:hypothetical protein
MKLMRPEAVVQAFVHSGFPESTLTGIGILELVCTLIYVIPRTSVLGAILLTGYMGGATATTLRLGEPFWAQPLVGVLLWAGIYLRDDRLKALIPLRTPPSLVG